MTITVNLPPAVEQHLRRSAARQGENLSVYVERILERTVAADDVSRTLTDKDIQALNADRTLSLLDLEGLGAEIWDGVDAQEYVDELRDEWDRRL